MRTKTTEEIINQYNKNGWAPVPFNHQPEKVKRAIKLARFRPAIKQCYANSQKLIVHQHEVQFKYYEGIVSCVIPIPHAWLELDGERIDVTLQEKPEILAAYEVTEEEILKHIVKTRSYGPIHEERLNILQTAILLNIPVTEDYDALKKSIDDIYKRLSDRNNDRNAHSPA